MQRRILLGGLSAALLSRAAQAGAGRRLTLRHAHTGARFDGPWHDGAAPDPAAMAELSAVLSDSAAIQPLPFDAAAVEILWEVAQRARLAGELVVRSGYRTPAINRAVHGAGDSQHLRAGAIDVEVTAGRMAAVSDAALRLGRGGVGLYPFRGFVHLDSGPVRRWSDDRVMEVRLTPREDRIGRIAAAWRASGGW
ncbi:YcbK family protein [Falsiroseomonas sp. CW058]|uniref:YcbK family protein n=1 Tax=Falsiroseomonas sp. CW058 TaxID=3388664 RepID=UPI003D31F656